MAHKKHAGLSNTSEQIAELMACGVSRRTVALEAGLTDSVVWKLFCGWRKPTAHEAQAVSRVHRRYVRQSNTVAGPPLQGKLGSLSPRG
ncbi:hypothetical protein [Sinorhizobium meliloti]|uniref:hypothetical protein n=1 Tax=Rhizobium meliloti TaxID=382 RepID=UPI00299ED7DF|nr:hypothetical protein [Sinorhizobium meliloti]